MKKIVLALSFIYCSLFAHSAIMDCFDNSDETITCSAGFSDGSSAQGVDLYVLQDGKKLIELRIDETSEATFDKPKGEYIVVLDGGEGHEIKINSSKIVE